MPPPKSKDFFNLTSRSFKKSAYLIMSLPYLLTGSIAFRLKPKFLTWFEMAST